MIETYDTDHHIILKPFAKGLRPIPRMTVSQWSNERRFLTSMSSAEPGRYRIERTPGLREILDCLGVTSDVQEVIFAKGAQIGATEAGNNWIGYTIDMDPGPFLLVMPTDGAIKKNSRTRLKPMIDSTPTLKEKIRPAGSKEAGNTIDSKEYPGGVLLMVGANSPVGLSSTPIRNLMLDEVDRYPKSAGEEGSPVDLAKARTRTFARRKILMISTPTNEGESVIWPEFLKGDQRYYHVPCRHCGELFIITFDCLTWETGKPETIRCACPECGGLHEERHKTEMFREEGFGGRAKWIPTSVSDNPRKRSYHMASWYSSAGFYSWEQLIRDYLESKGDVNKERTFINTVRGETYKIKGEAPDHERLYNRREDYAIGTVPDPVVFLTMGVDVQKDRLEAEVVGWCPGRVTYSIEYFIMSGDTSKKEVWGELTKVINMQFPCSDGKVMPISMTCVDAGFNTKTVTDYTSRFLASKVVPIMGRDSVKDVMVTQPKALNITKTGEKIKKHMIWFLGTTLLKAELYGFLKQDAQEIEGVEVYPDGYCHFPQYNREYFEQLTAEEQVLVVDKKGYSSYQWNKKRLRNEALDVRCYARAASYLVGIDRFKEDTWEKFKKKVQTAPVVAAAPRPTKPVKRASGFWDKKK